MSNQSKYASYREAWGRIAAANDGDFPFEAVTIAESIISDRILSYLKGVDPSGTYTVKTSFYELIKSWKQKAYNAELGESSNSLPDRVNRWRLERNRVVHSLAKSEPGTPTAEVENFLNTARDAAEKGAELAREVCNWHREELRST